MRISVVAAVAIALIAPAISHAEPPRGWGIGARVEHGVSGVGIDYWGSCYGASFLLGTSVYTPIEDELDGARGDSRYGIVVSAGGLASVARTARARVAVGARLAFGFEDSTSPYSDVTAGWSRLEVPLRVQWLVAQRITVHVELGVSFGVTVRRYEGGDPIVGGVSYDERYHELTTFGHPLSSLGVTYYF